jgi:hypothetical protein
MVGREVRLMVKIRYAELPAGLHVATEARGDCTVVYLLPGLTPTQRRAALTFARRAARLGHGPSLPRVDMAFALAADRARTTASTIIAALRRHPMLLLPLVAIVSGVIVAAMLSFVPVSLSPLKGPATAPAPKAASGRVIAGPAIIRPRPPAGRPGEPHASSTPDPQVSMPASVALRPPSGDEVPSPADVPSSRPAHLRASSGSLCMPLGPAAICVRS